MKHLLLNLVLMLIVASCTDESSTSSSSNTELCRELSNNGYFSGRLIIPTSGIIGVAEEIEYLGNSYLIGSQSDSDVVNEIGEINPGTYNILFKGTLAQETGIFPNPTQRFNVIHLNDFAECDQI